MRGRSFGLLPVLFLLCGAAPAITARDAPPRCTIPAEYVTDEDTFAQVRAAIANKAPIDILAVGSATTVGQDLLPLGNSFPYRMTADLQAALPDSKISLTVVGARGMSAGEMLALIRAELAKQRYALVLWQTGTVEAARKIGPNEFHDVLTEGVDAVKAQGGDVLLIDPQFSQFLVANSEIGPYEQVFREISSAPGVIEFRRFDLMKHWAETGDLDLEHVAKNDRGPVLERLHTCLGTALSRLVLAASGQAPAIR